MSVIVLNWSPCEPKSHPTGCGCKFFIITKDCEKLNQYSFICCINCEKNFVQFHRMFAMYILIILYCFWSLISWLLLPTRPCFQGTNMTNPVIIFSWRERFKNRFGVQGRECWILHYYLGFHNIAANHCMLMRNSINHTP